MRYWLPALTLALLSPPAAAVTMMKRATTKIPSAASFFVPSLPDLHQDPSRPLRIWAGHILADPTAPQAADTDTLAHLYFVLTKARRTADKERVLFWFNGGPGCSSFDGLMMEIGPWRVDGKGGLQFQEGGWEEYTNVIYIDQPAGTGFSYTSTDKYVHELSEATNQMIVFWNNFYQVFPELLTMDTYIAGESFAGQYIPYFAQAMLDSPLKIPIRGAAIGNGWMDGRHQYPGFLQYGVKHGLLEENSDNWKAAKKVTDDCIAELDGKYKDSSPINTDNCEQILFSVLKGREHVANGTRYCTNIYDVRLEDTVPACGMNWPPDLKEVKPYLGRQDVVAALHAQAKPTAWEECVGRVHTSLVNKYSPSSVTLMPKILSRIPMMFFAGDQDFICNYVGVENMIRSLEWNGGVGLGTVETQNWSVNNTPAGTWVTSRNLTYVKIFNASHMVGYDLPHVAHDMILRFMGVDFSFLTNGSARIPSSVGSEHKPSVVLADEAPPATTSKVVTPEMDKAMWEAYYNAGSAALVLVLVLAAILAFFWCRRRRARAFRQGGGGGGGGGVQLPGGGADEESIPLSRSMGGSEVAVGNGHYEDEDDGHRRYGERAGFSKEGKGKERAGNTVFEVGDSDGESDRH